MESSPETLRPGVHNPPPKRDVTPPKKKTVYKLVENRNVSIPPCPPQKNFNCASVALCGDLAGSGGAAPARRVLRSIPRAPRPLSGALPGGAGSGGPPELPTGFEYRLAARYDPLNLNGAPLSSLGRVYARAWACACPAHTFCMCLRTCPVHLLGLAGVSQRIYRPPVKASFAPLKRPARFPAPFPCR